MRATSASKEHAWTVIGALLDASRHGCVCRCRLGRGPTGRLFNKLVKMESWRFLRVETAAFRLLKINVKNRNGCQCAWSSGDVPDRPMMMWRDGFFRFSHRLGFFGGGGGAGGEAPGCGGLIAVVRCDLLRDFGDTSHSDGMFKKGDTTFCATRRE